MTKKQQKLIQEWLNVNAFLIHEVCNGNGSPGAFLQHREILKDINISKTIPPQTEFITSLGDKLIWNDRWEIVTKPE